MTATELPPTPPVGVLGGTSLVGRWLLERLIGRGSGVLACSRSPAPADGPVVWCRPGGPLPDGAVAPAEWIGLCPLWAVVEQADWLASLGARRLVALSSTSVLVKRNSRDPADRRLADRLADAEAELTARAVRLGVTLSILRPTMIYDGRSDANVTAIAACVRRFGLFPLCGPALGLRQPVHAADVAAACVAALDHPRPRARYTLSGGEAIPFRELVRRTCRAHGLPPRVAHLPRPLWHSLAAAARGLGIAPTTTAALGDRMNDDLVFDHAEAAADLGFNPRPFLPAADTLSQVADEGAATHDRSQGERRT